MLKRRLYAMTSFVRQLGSIGAIAGSIQAVYSRFFLLSLCLLAVAGCKGGPDEADRFLSPKWAGSWAAENQRFGCEKRSIRFEKTQVVMNIGGQSLPVFSIQHAGLRGDVAELTLAMADVARGLAFAGKEEKLEQARKFRLHVTLVNHGDRLTVSDVQMENPVTGRRPAGRSDRRKVERLFVARKCPA